MKLVEFQRKTIFYGTSARTKRDSWAPYLANQSSAWQRSSTQVIGKHQRCCRSNSSRKRRYSSGSANSTPADTSEYMPPADGPKPLVVVGSANADLVVRINRLPLAGETLAAEDFSTFPGGKGANQAAAAGRLEYPTFFIGQFGGDGFADLIRDSLRNCGVDCSLCRQVDAPTGNAVILLQPNAHPGRGDGLAPA